MDTKRENPLFIYQRNTGAFALVCMHLLNMRDIILVGDNIIILLS